MKRLTDKEEANLSLRIRLLRELTYKAYHLFCWLYDHYVPCPKCGKPIEVGQIDNCKCRERHERLTDKEEANLSLRIRLLRELTYKAYHLFYWLYYRNVLCPNCGKLIEVGQLANCECRE